MMPNPRFGDEDFLSSRFLRIDEPVTEPRIANDYLPAEHNHKRTRNVLPWMLVVIFAGLFIWQYRIANDLHGKHRELNNDYSNRINQNWELIRENRILQFELELEKIQREFAEQRLEIAKRYRLTSLRTPLDRNTSDNDR